MISRAIKLKFEKKALTKHNISAILNTDNTDDTVNTEVRAMNIKFTGKVSIYLEIYEELRKLIKLGVYQKGEKLPSVRNLALELAVNPNTISRAYEKLENEGYIQTIEKRGVYVSEPIELNKEDFEDLKNLIVKHKESGTTRGKIIEIIDEVYGESD